MASTPSSDIPSRSATEPPTSTNTTADTTSTTNSNKTLTSEQISTYLDDPRLNKTFQLPPDHSRGRPEPLQISYADFGHQPQDDSEEQHVLLFFGPLVGSRLFHSAKDELAKKYNVRFVMPERPGIGKTDSVPADKMLDTWRDAIPALLSHLSIPHVTIASHSAGTLYALDFALHNPTLLSPKRPYIALASPWVHPSHSGMVTWNLASQLPASLLGQTDKLVSWANAAIGPVLGVSAAVSSPLMAQIPKAENKPTKGRNDEDVVFEEALQQGVSKRVFSESVSAVGPEVKILMRKGVEEDGWSDWKDIDSLAPRLSEIVGAGTSAKLKVDVFFSEHDHMIGDAGSKGPTWFESCWKNVDGIDFTSEVVKDATHDFVWDLRWDTMEKVFQRMTA